MQSYSLARWSVTFFTISKLRKKPSPIYIRTDRVPEKKLPPLQVYWSYEFKKPNSQPDAHDGHAFLDTIIKIRALGRDKFEHDRISFAVYAIQEQDIRVGFSFGTDYFKEIIAS